VEERLIGNGGGAVDWHRWCGGGRAKSSPGEERAVVATNGSSIHLWVQWNRTDWFWKGILELA
jgi:hypothetical protein